MLTDVGVPVLCHVVVAAGVSPAPTALVPTHSDVRLPEVGAPAAGSCARVVCPGGVALGTCASPLVTSAAEKVTWSEPSDGESRGSTVTLEPEMLPFSPGLTAAAGALTRAPRKRKSASARRPPAIREDVGQTS